MGKTQRITRNILLVKPHLQDHCGLLATYAGKAALIKNADYFVSRTVLILGIPSLSVIPYGLDVKKSWKLGCLGVSRC